MITDLPTALLRISADLSRSSRQFAVAPEVGEDNDYILGDLLGLGRAERAELIAEGAVWG